MAHLLEIKTFKDDRGSLTVLDRELPFKVQRIYYIYDVPHDQIRAGHRHRKNIQALICIRGACNIYVNNGVTQETYLLDSSERCLIMEPEDWHTMYNFTPDAMLLVLASEPYDRDDYIDEEYS